MLAIRRSAEAAFIIIVLAMLNGCGTTPLPVPVISGDVHTLAQAPPGHLDVVIQCIKTNLEENAGLKIAGVIAEEGESPYVFATPEKSDGLLVVQIKEIGLDDSAKGIRLTLFIRVFDGLGKNVYVRSITSIYGADLSEYQSSNIEKALQIVTKDVLRQYAKDPTLRPLILKYKLGALMKFI